MNHDGSQSTEQGPGAELENDLSDEALDRDRMSRVCWSWGNNDGLPMAASPRKS